MDFTVNSFGGVLIRTSQGYFAVNGGGSLEEMEKAYLQSDRPLIALILTSEHVDRSRNVELFAAKHHVPILTSLVTQCQLHLHHVPLMYCFPPAELNLYGVKIGLHHIRYDSVDPFYLTLEDDEKIGIVIDGKLNPKTAEPLMDCRKILLANEIRMRENMPMALYRRIISVFNTHEELENLFCNSSGTVCYAQAL